MVSLSVFSCKHNRSTSHSLSVSFYSGSQPTNVCMENDTVDRRCPQTSLIQDTTSGCHTSVKRHQQEFGPISLLQSQPPFSCLPPTGSTDSPHFHVTPAN